MFNTWKEDKNYTQHRMNTNIQNKWFIFSLAISAIFAGPPAFQINNCSQSTQLCCSCFTHKSDYMNYTLQSLCTNNNNNYHYYYNYIIASDHVSDHLSNNSRCRNWGRCHKKASQISGPQQHWLSNSVSLDFISDLECILTLMNGDQREFAFLFLRLKHSTLQCRNILGNLLRLKNRFQHHSRTLVFPCSLHTFLGGLSDSWYLG